MIIYKVEFQCFSGTLVNMSRGESGLDSRDRASPDHHLLHNNACSICSTVDTPVYHRHYSSRWLREILGVENDENASFYCPPCKSRHEPYPYSRTKVLVSDETLHPFFAPPAHNPEHHYSGDLMHVDYITIPGASINELAAAFQAEFVNKQARKPLDVVLVAGYRELRLGHSIADIEERFRSFADQVLAAKVNGENNTVAISDFIFLPSLAWFPDNGQMPFNQNGNILHIMEWLNEVILSINLDNNITEFHRLHKYGVLVYTKRKRNQYGYEQHQKIKEHRFEHWLGQDRALMTTLKADQRIKIGAAINKYFWMRTSGN